MNSKYDEFVSRGPQLVVCVYEISKSDEYNESHDTGYMRIYGDYTETTR